MLFFFWNINLYRKMLVRGVYRMKTRSIFKAVKLHEIQWKLETLASHHFILTKLCECRIIASAWLCITKLGKT